MIESCKPKRRKTDFNNKIIYPNSQNIKLNITRNERMP